MQNSQNLTVNHRIPISRGGTNEAENLQILCRACHERYHGM